MYTVRFDKAQVFIIICIIKWIIIFFCKRMYLLSDVVGHIWPKAVTRNVWLTVTLVTVNEWGGGAAHRSKNTISRNPSKNDFVQICWSSIQKIPACKKPAPFDEAFKRYSNFKILPPVTDIWRGSNEWSLLPETYPWLQ